MNITPHFVVRGSVEYSYDYAAKKHNLTDKVQWIRATREFATKEEAAAFAATLPKSCKIRGSSISGHVGDAWACWGWISCDVSLTKDGVNGGVNEGGIARVRKFLSKVDYKIETDSRIANPATVEQIKQVLGL